MSHLWYQDTIRGVRALEKGAMCDVAEGSPVHPCPSRALLCASLQTGSVASLPSSPLMCLLLPTYFPSPSLPLPSQTPAFSTSVPQDVSDRCLPPPRAMHTHHPASSCLLPPAALASSLLPPSGTPPAPAPPVPSGESLAWYFSRMWARH